jgi:hypothetical protein
MIVGFLSFAFFLLLTHLPAHAQQAYFLQSVINTNNYTYQGNVLFDNVSGSATDPSKHLEEQTGNFYQLDAKVEMVPQQFSTASWYQTNMSPTGSTQVQTMTQTTLYNEPFTFEPFPTKSYTSNQFNNNATSADEERAWTIESNLVPGLNSAIYLINGNSAPTSMQQLFQLSNELGTAIQNGVGTITGANGTKYTLQIGTAPTGTPKVDPSTGIENRDYLKISSGGQSDYFVYRMIKGYTVPEQIAYQNGQTEKWVSPVYPSNPDIEALFNGQSANVDIKAGDATYITWNMLMIQAEAAYINNGTTAANSNNITNPTALEQDIVGFFSDMLGSLRNWLELYPLNDIVYNQGVHGTLGWVQGVLPTSWMQTASLFEWVTQLLAWSLLVFAIAKALIQRSISLINPALRASLIEDIQNLLITALLLPFIGPFVSMVMELNMDLVSWFYTLVPANYDITSGINDYSSTIGGIVMQFFNFFVLLYLNMVEIMRAITVALLIATAPLFVVSIAFGAKWRHLFATWARELMGNIFLQSFQAFILAFFINIPADSRFIVQAAILFAMIPMTEFFRGLIVGQGGAMAHVLGTSALSTGLGMASGLTKGATNSAKKIAGNRGPNQNGNSNSSGANNNADPFSPNSGRGREQKTNDTGLLNTAFMRSKQDAATRNVKENMQLSPHEYKDSDELSRYNKPIDSLDMKGKDHSGAISTILGAAGKTALGAGSAVLGATEVLSGAGQALALGGVSPGAAKQGIDRMGSGVGRIKNVGKAAAVGAKDIGLQKLNDFQQAKIEKKRPLWMESTPDGNVLVHHSQQRMNDLGIVDAMTEQGGKDKEGFAHIKYNSNKMSGIDRENVEQAYAAYHSGDKDQIAAWKGIGVVGANKDKNDNIELVYNNKGKQALGLDAITRMNDGRFIEKKNRYQPTYSKVTLGLPLKTPPSPGSGTPSPIGKALNPKGSNPPGEKQPHYHYNNVSSENLALMNRVKDKRGKSPTEKSKSLHGYQRPIGHKRNFNSSED